MSGEGDLSFEDALGELEQRVRSLERGDVPLDTALGLFEEGVELARTCHERLDAAEQRVAALSRTSRGTGDQGIGAKGIGERPITDVE